MCLSTHWCTIVSFLLLGILTEAQQKPLFSTDGVQANLGLERPKNIVLIMTDDQDAVMNSDAYMPRLKEHIIDQGTFFSNHFTTTAICCPSRVSLWTGKQPHNTNVTDVDPPYGGFPKFISQGLNEAYLPVWLQEAGYATFYTGKMFNSHTINNYNSPFLAGWTSSNFLLDPGTYSYMNPICQKDHEKPIQYNNWHTTDLIQSHTSDLLSQALQSEKPFFLGIAPIAPHANIDSNTGGSPAMTEPISLHRHEHLFSELGVPRTANFNPESSSGVSWVANLPRLNETSVQYLDHFYRQRLRALQGVDELIEQVVTQLENAGVLDDTYIIFTSDNGYHLGQHRLPPGKECGFEEDIRVPLYIRGPGVAKGRTEKAVTAHIDLAPTFFKIAGIELRDDFDGTPIPLSVNIGMPGIRHEHVAVEYWGTAIAEGTVGGFDAQGQIVMPNNTYKALRVKGEFYDIFYSVWCNNEHELYNIKDDPGQMRNLYPVEENSSPAFDRSFPGWQLSHLVARLDSLMMVMKSCRGQSCVQPWRTLHPEGDVETLEDALQPWFNAFYEDQVKVTFTKCETGYIIDSEGPQTGYEYRQGLRWSHWS